MIKVAVNPHHKNKMPLHMTGDETKLWWYEFNGGFVNMRFPTPAQFMKSIREGYAYTAQHDGYRKADNFIMGQHVGLDFDTGDERSSFEYLVQDNFIRDNASFLHTTPSHRDAKPHARAIFILKNPIRSKEKYTLLTESFAQTYAENYNADRSCQDPVRIFFGSEECDMHFFGNILDLKVAAKEIVNPYKQRKHEDKNLRSLFEAETYSDFSSAIEDSHAAALRDSLLSHILNAPDGDKHRTLIKISRTFGGYISAGYFDEEETKQWIYAAIASRPSTKNLDVAWNAIEFGVSAGKMKPLHIKKEQDNIIDTLFG